MLQNVPTVLHKMELHHVKDVREIKVVKLLQNSRCYIVWEIFGNTPEVVW